MKNSIPIYSVSVSEYNLEQTPNFSIIGSKLDQIIQSHFRDQWVALRAISLQDHPDTSIDALISIICELGTDRYDPQRRGVHHTIDQQFGIDLHAIPLIFREKMYCPHYQGERCETGSALGELLNDCYGGAIIDRGYALRIDLLMIYDLNELKAAPMIWTEEGPIYTDNYIPPSETCTFRFIDPDKKREALAGLIKIDR